MFDLDLVEPRVFYVKHPSDACGDRVWVGVVEGPARETTDRTRYAIYCRTDLDQQYPAQTEQRATLAEAYARALEIAQLLITTLPVEACATCSPSWHDPRGCIKVQRTFVRRVGE